MNAVATIEPVTDFELEGRVEPLEIIDLAIEKRFNGEIYFVGDEFQAKAAVCEGRLAWVYCSSHLENLGQLLEREESIGRTVLAAAMEEAKATHRRFGELLVEKGLLTLERLRASLKRHLAAHLKHLGVSTGTFELAFVERHYRYDHELTFTATEVLAEAVFAAARVALPFANAFVLARTLQCDAVAASEGTPRDVADVLAQLAVCTESFGERAAIRQGPVFYRADAVLYCVQPLRSHPRFVLGTATNDARKLGLFLQRVTALAEKI